MSSPPPPPPPSDAAALGAAQAEIERLRKLVEASKLINSSIEGDALLESILQVARQELGVERGTLFFVDDSREELWAKIADGLGAAEDLRLPVGQGIAGTVAATGESVLIDDPYEDPRFDPSVDRRTGFRASSMLCVPIHNREQRIVGVLQLLNKREGRFGRSDLEFLQSLSEHMAIAIENALLHLRLVARERMARELQLGRDIQSRLLPAPPRDVPGTRLSAWSVPCYEVGGDSYDFLALPRGELGLAIGDVSGKGVAAALVMSSLQAALRVAAPLEPDIRVLGGILNRLIHELAGGRKYVTFFFGRYEPETGVLRFLNAGHLPPVVVAPGGEARLLETTGRPIGILPGSSYEERRVEIPQGATLVLYTDGLTEAMSPGEEELGAERWLGLVREAAAEPLEDAAARLREAVARFEGGAEPADDKTLVLLRRQAV